MADKFRSRFHLNRTWRSEKTNHNIYKCQSENIIPEMSSKYSPLSVLAFMKLYHRKVRVSVPVCPFVKYVFI